MLGPHEARLRVMIDPMSLADWGLNDEDKAAIQWALDVIASQERDRREGWEMAAKRWIEMEDVKKKAREAIAALSQAVA